MSVRLGFVGLGWIGRNRLQSMIEGGVQPAAYLEPHAANLETAQQTAPAPGYEDLDAFLERDMDGVVIATPNALHAPQSRAALERGLPVFCQKPLSPRHQEAVQVVEAAEEADLLLDVDWSYRGTTALRALRDAYNSGSIGDCYHAELWFHNAYGPDKPWYRDRNASGGGCLVDLGCHLLDALHWVLDPDALHVKDARMYRNGLRARSDGLEDHAILRLVSEGLSSDVACSWNVPSGGDCDVRFTFYGPRGVLRLENVGGSFYDFCATLLTGDGTKTLAAPPDAWGGRQAMAWVRRLDDGHRRFDGTAWQTTENARLLEEAYRCAS